MKKIGNILESQIRETGYLLTNNSMFKHPLALFFVQLDDDHAVDNTGAIFQIVDKDSATEVEKNPNALQYEGDLTGMIYNYAEDKAEFPEDSEDLEIYSHCFQQAELLSDTLF